MVPNFFFPTSHQSRNSHQKYIWDKDSSTIFFRFVCAVLTFIFFTIHPEPLHAQNESSKQKVITFNHHIRPILSEHCFACHGPDGANREAGLRLDLADSATALLDSGLHAIVPNEVEKSEVIARTSSDDPDLVMPPPSAKLGKLSSDDIDLLKAWIARGAIYEPHWAFIPAKVPKTYSSELHPIDGLLTHRLHDRGLQLQPKADHSTLIRRTSFDLTGLPPSTAELEFFLKDSSPHAYEQLLDRLLQSPGYGERMAADWLDIARYSDSYGFQRDTPRPNMWPWRDWVVTSFNENMSWDRFVLWQIAGDLLPDATDDQILATAFNRLHQQENEGGSVSEEYRIRYVNDRVTTFGTAFLGLTLECCRCHDHKFDPISQKDFYSLFAFFDDIEEAGLYSFFTQATPTPTLQLANADLHEQINCANQEIHKQARDLQHLKKHKQETIQKLLIENTSVRDRSDPENFSILGEVAHYSFDARLKNDSFPCLIDTRKPDQKLSSKTLESEEARTSNASGTLLKTAATSPPNNTLVPGQSGMAIKLTGDHPVKTPVGNFSRSESFSVSCWVNIPTSYERAVVFHRSKAWTDAGSQGYELIVDLGHLRWSLIHFWPGNAASIRMLDEIPVNRWVHIAVSSDGTGRTDGLKIFLDGQQVKTEVVHDTLTRTISSRKGNTISIGERMRDHGLKNGSIDEFRVFNRALSPLEIQECYQPGTLAQVMHSNTNVHAVGEYLTAIDKDVLQNQKQLQSAYKTRNKLVEKTSEIMVMKEQSPPKKAFVLLRGEYDKKGEAIQPDTPPVLPAFATQLPRNRLGLSQWLLDPEHPLLARVTVNRFWQSLFGHGLVRSSEDFGSQATQPEYPELLDLLAWKFSHAKEEGGFSWDVKALMKFIMTSDVYQQKSMARHETMVNDPANEWLARGPRHRLPAEMIRDAALAASGLLDKKSGGPPVKPYDIAESFKPEKIDSGTALYRRSIYTYWRRSGPAPLLEAFDLPNRVVCTAKRDTTNTPLHALVLLNGTQFVEASRVLAENVLLEHSNNLSTAIKAAFYLLTSRHPDDDEQEILNRMIDNQRHWYESHPKDAKKLLAVGQKARNKILDPIDVAAVATVVSGLLALDESVMKR